jgi:hypothetical protein
MERFDDDLDLGGEASGFKPEARSEEHDQAPARGLAMDDYGKPTFADWVNPNNPTVFVRSGVLEKRL